MLTKQTNQAIMQLLLNDFAIPIEASKAPVEVITTLLCFLMANNLQSLAKQHHMPIEKIETGFNQVLHRALQDQAIDFTSTDKITKQPENLTLYQAINQVISESQLPPHISLDTLQFIILQQLQVLSELMQQDLSTVVANFCYKLTSRSLAKFATNNQTIH